MRRVVLYDHPDVLAYEEDGVVYEAPTAYEYAHGLLSLERQIIADKITLNTLENALAEEEAELHKTLELKEWFEKRGEDIPDGNTIMDRISECHCEIAKDKQDIAETKAHLEECQRLLAEQ